MLGASARAAGVDVPATTTNTHAYQVNAVHMMLKQYIILEPAVRPTHHAPILDDHDRCRVTTMRQERSEQG